MNRRQGLVSLAAAGAIGTASLVAAPSAMAAASPSTIYVRCQSSQISAFSDAARTTPVTGVSADPNDSLTVVFQTGDGSTLSVSPSITCNNASYEYDQDASGPVSVNATSSDQTVALTLSLTEFATSLFIQMNGTLTGALNLPITYSGGGGGGGGSSESSQSSTPSPVLQQFGMPATGTCDEAQPEGLNLAGVTSGGWSESWGRWEGYEGPVCTRTLVYSNALAKWTVN